MTATHFGLACVCVGVFVVSVCVSWSKNEADGTIFFVKL